MTHAPIASLWPNAKALADDAGVSLPMAYKWRAGEWGISPRRWTNLVAAGQARGLPITLTDFVTAFGGSEFSQIDNHSPSHTDTPIVKEACLIRTDTTKSNSSLTNCTPVQEASCAADSRESQTPEHNLSELSTTWPRRFGQKDSPRESIPERSL